MTVQLEFVSRTHPGLIRSLNEDSVAVDSGVGAVVVADGLAAHRGAELAAEITTTVILERLRESTRSAASDALEGAIASAHRAIRIRSKAEPMLDGMGATFVTALFRDGSLAVAHVGDTRIYRYRDGQLECLTVDHSFVQEQLARGVVTAEEARASKSRNLVTRALGVAEEAHAELAEHETRAGDLYLLCTDGLHELVDNDDIAAALEVLGANLDLTAETLIKMANDRGGRDNVSVALVRIGPADGARKRGVFDSIFGRR